MEGTREDRVESDRDSQIVAEMGVEYWGGCVGHRRIPETWHNRMEGSDKIRGRCIKRKLGPWLSSSHLDGLVHGQFLTSWVFWIWW